VPRALWLPDRLTEFGLHVVLHDGWQTRGSTDFDPKLVVCHHTAVKGSAVNVCIKGRPDLPGPLCHVVLARDGAAHVIASGKANHAGAGGWAGYSGNRRALGIEADNDGHEPWPAVQVEAFQRCAAAMLAGIGQDPSFVCGHREWAPNRKVDPHSLDLNAFRAAVGLDLHWWQHRNDTPPAIEEDDDMPWVYREAESNAVYFVNGRKRVHIERDALKALQAAGVVPAKEPAKVAGFADLFSG
jgi:hypothetical protein